MRVDRLASNGRRSFPRFFVLLGCLGLLLGVVAVGCGLDDSVVTVLGEDPTENKDASLVDVGVGDVSVVGEGGAPDTGPGCTPKGCGAFPGDCHSTLDDGCGGKIDCSSACPTDQQCVGDAGAGNPGGAYCNGKPPCLDAGATGGNCGTITNTATGQTNNCGSCTNASTDSCYQSLCCTKRTCAGSYAGKCGATNDDGCGGNLSCTAACSGATPTCAGDGFCDVAPTCMNKDMPGGSCGTLTSTHGLTTDCGATCNGGYSCNASHTCVCPSGQVTCNSNSLCCAAGQVCNANACCTPDSMATTCNNKCGTTTNNCGQTVNCGDCSPGDVCFTGPCNCVSGSDTASCNAGDECCHFMNNTYCHGGAKCF